MAESVRPIDGADGSDWIDDEVLDRWDRSGERPVFCNALLRRMIHEHAIRVNDEIGLETQFVPPAFVDLYQMAVSEFDPVLDVFGQFCVRFGIDAKPYLQWARAKAHGQPVLMGKMQDLLQITLVLLCHRAGINTGIFPGIPKKLFLVGGHLYNQAEKLAGAIYEKAGI